MLVVFEYTLAGSYARGPAQSTESPRGQARRAGERRRVRESTEKQQSAWKERDDGGLIYTDRRL